MNLFHYIVLLLLLLSFIFSSVACVSEEPLSLNGYDKKIVDSLFIKRTSNLRQELDSICTLQHDSLIRLEMDSMLNIRLLEIARQRQRFEERQKKK